MGRAAYCFCFQVSEGFPWIPARQTRRRVTQHKICSGITAPLNQTSGLLKVLLGRANASCTFLIVVPEKHCHACTEKLKMHQLVITFVLFISYHAIWAKISRKNKQVQSGQTRTVQFNSNYRYTYWIWLIEHKSGCTWVNSDQCIKI